MKERFRIRRVYKRRVGNIVHIPANVTGTYGVWDSKQGDDENGRGFREGSPQRREIR